MNRLKSLVIDYHQREPWERMEREPPVAFRAFQIFRDIGPSRTVRKAFYKYKGIPEDSDQRVTGRWCEWAVAYTWRERAQLWDDHLDRIARQTIEEEIRSTAKIHAQQCRNFAVVLSRMEQMFIDRMKNPKHVESLRTKDLLDAVIRGAGLLPRLQEAEMVALGKNPQNNVVVSGDPDRPIMVRHLPPQIIDESDSPTQSGDGETEESNT